MRVVNKLYYYVGPAGIKDRVAGRPMGMAISSVACLLAWVHDTDRRPGSDGLVAATFVMDEKGILLVADRRTEHVACCGGGPVLSAGELFLSVEAARVEVVEASNQSTGFCPEPESWPVVAAALDRIGLAHPGRFTQEIVFRRCGKCGERNVVKDGWFVCGMCGAELAAEWNF
jgi:hypothetical protein